MCSGICPAARIVGRFNPRRMLWEAFLGLENEATLGENVWLCLGCHLCLEACPTRVKVSHVITLLKNLAAGRGNMPDGFLQEVNTIFKTGRSIPSSPAIEKKRLELSLPSLPAVDVEEVRALLKKLNLPINNKRGDGK
ncbi:MAG: 4Fe-4S dicluster domain-containing protein [Candidatus Freyarchaeota archaeon]|nr:4Fe-4S dicluster domain-containing protein [Candidatus Jordarchaeia archaeon]